MLEQLVRQMPEGVYVRSVKQQGLRLLHGFAQSNARVSTLMRNIESSPWLASPGLVEVKAATVAKRRISEFNLNFQVKRAEVKDAGKAKPQPQPQAKKG
jgi:type IV pilus assembly protein PilN